MRFCEGVCRSRLFLISLCVCIVDVSFLFGQKIDVLRTMRAALDRNLLGFNACNPTSGLLAGRISVTHVKRREQPDLDSLSLQLTVQECVFHLGYYVSSMISV